jgi:hypothetical protein
MADLFGGERDARQSDQSSVPTSRFRPVYRALTDDEKLLHDDIKSQAQILEELIEQTEGGRYRALALTALEESVMWAVKGLTA